MEDKCNKENIVRCHEQTVIGIIRMSFCNENNETRAYARNLLPLQPSQPLSWGSFSGDKKSYCRLVRKGLPWRAVEGGALGTN